MPTVPTLPGIISRMVPTPRIKTHVLLSGPANGIPVVFIHGNFSAATWFEETMLALPEKYRAIAPDLCGYGDTEDLLIDATRGARDWSDDLKSLSDQLGERPGHLVGWSMGAAPIMQFVQDYPELVASITFISPVSPYGFGGTKGLDGEPCYDDYAGCGGGLVSPDFVRMLKEKNRGEDDPNSPRNVINTFLFKPPFRADREEEFLTASMLERIGEDRYPGDSVPSDNWPGLAPGVWGPPNAFSPKYFNGSGIIDMPKKPPILWIRGDSDQISSDNSMFDFAVYGQLGAIPGWPGEDVFPPQPMVGQMRAVLDKYQANGGAYEEFVIEDCGHSPLIEKPEVFREKLIAFLDSV